jgi:hypothetical protein
LFEHAELDFLCGCCDDEVECVAQDGCVGYAVYSGKIEEGQGLLETVEDADGGKE